MPIRLSATMLMDEIEHEGIRPRFEEPRIHFAQHLAAFLPPGPERALLESGRFEIRYTDYDWSLNLQR